MSAHSRAWRIMGFYKYLVNSQLKGRPRDLRTLQPLLQPEPEEKHPTRSHLPSCRADEIRIQAAVSWAKETPR